MPRFKNKDSLLSDFVGEIRASDALVTGPFSPRGFGEAKLNDIEIALRDSRSETENPVVTMSALEFLEAVADDLFWNEDADWSETDQIDVYTI